MPIKGMMNSQKDRVLLDHKFKAELGKVDADSQIFSQKDSALHAMCLKS